MGDSLIITVLWMQMINLEPKEEGWYSYMHRIFHMVQNFVVFADSLAAAKIRTTKKFST